MEEKVQNEVTITQIIKRSVDLFKYLLSKWVIIFSVAFAFGLLGILYAWLQKPVYTAEMSFTTESESGGKLSAYAGLAAQFGFDLGGGSNNIFEGDNLAELFKSRNLIQKTLLTPSGNGKLMIEDYLIDNNIQSDGKMISFGSSLPYSRLQDSILMNAYTAIVTSQLDVFRKDKKLSIIILRMKGSNEEFCKKFVELLASNAIQFYTDYKSRKARQNVEILQKQTDSVRTMLFGSMSDVASINDLNVNPTRQSVKIPSQRRQIDVQVNGTLYGELLKNLELSKLALRKETPLIQVIDSPQYPLEKKKPGRLMTGILFAFLGGLIAMLFLVVRKYIIGAKLF